MNTLHKILSGLVLVLAVSLNANATFGPVSTSISEVTENTDMVTRSSLLLVASNDDDVNDHDDDGQDDDSHDDDGRDDDGRDDDGKEDDGKEDDGTDS